MSPLSVGLAEVDQRLRSLRRRLNEFTLLHAVCLASSALALVSAALIVLGLLASAAAFRVATVIALALTTTIAVAAAVYLRRRWLDVPAAAWIVDRRGQLTDRLTTLVALQAQPCPSRLVPILVKQTLALGTRWQPRSIQPRRLPRSAFILLATILALASTGFVSRHLPTPPPPSEVAPKAAPQPAPGAQGELPEAPQPGQRMTDGATHRLAADAPEFSDEALLHGTNGEAGGDLDGRGADDHGRPMAIAALPDRLQEAIRQTFKAEPIDRPRPLGGGSQVDLDGAKPQPDGPSSDRDAEARQPGDPRSRDVSRPGGKQKDQSQTSKPGEQDGKSRNPGRTAPQQNDSSPGAGGASNPSGLMGSEGMEAVLGGDGPKTFKLTITSFLRGMEQKGKPERQGGKRVATTGAAASGSGAALSDRQLGDGLLRKAEIPPEYEDIVRRVYSARASR